MAEFDSQFQKRRAATESNLHRVPDWSATFSNGSDNACQNNSAGGFEVLEERTLLAANVTAVLSGGTLTITGDATSQLIMLDGDGISGHVSLETNGQSLIVNGVAIANNASGPDFDFSGVKNIVVNTNDGADLVNAYDLNIVGNVSINLGAGNRDVANVYSKDDTSFIGGSVVLNGGTGINDHVSVFNDTNNDMTIGGNVGLTVKNGGVEEVSTNRLGDLTIKGNLTFSAQTTAGALSTSSLFTRGDGDITVGGRFLANGGAGNDLVRVFTSGGNIQIIRDLLITGGTGNDSLEITTNEQGSQISILGAAILNGNAGDDDLLVRTLDSGSEIEAASILITGDVGNDEIEILGGFGNDTTTINTLALTVLAGDGNDEIEVEGTSVFTNIALCVGGGGRKRQVLCREQRGTGQPHHRRWPGLRRSLPEQ